MAKKRTQATSSEEKGEQRKISVKLYLTETEYELLKSAASGHGLSAGKFARQIILDNIEEELEKVQKKITQQLKEMRKGKS